MTAISPSTQRRLHQLPQLPTVWEGDRRKMARLVDESELEDDRVRELIVWVDGVDCLVRSMEVVSETMGSEAIVRALIKAMEAPQAPSTSSPSEDHRARSTVTILSAGSAARSGNFCRVCAGIADYR